MITKDFNHLSAHTIDDLPRHAVSRAPASHNVAMTLLGFAAAAIVFAVLWVFYVYG